MPADRATPRATKRARVVHADASDPCEICGQVLSRKSDMPRHMKTHDTSEKIPCYYEGCTFSTLQKSNFETHIRRHKKEKNFPCNDDPDCDFKTCDSASLLRHRKRMHGYVPRATASKKEAGESMSKDEASSSRRNPHRIPVSVIRTVNHESDAPTKVLGQFSSFASGSGSASGSAFGQSTPVDTLSDLSELSDLTESEGDINSLPSTPSASLSPYPASSVSSPLPAVDVQSTSAFFMTAPQLYLPQDLQEDRMDLFGWSSVKPQAGISSPLDDYQWVWRQHFGTTADVESLLYPDYPESQKPFVPQYYPGDRATGFYPASSVASSSTDSFGDSPLTYPITSESEYTLRLPSPGSPASNELEVTVDDVFGISTKQQQEPHGFSLDLPDWDAFVSQATPSYSPVASSSSSGLDLSRSMTLESRWIFP